tara:strand:+ start:520 stop:1575 length:1056 start_codon:yes stop_codon:yes gene_type:complete
MKNLLISGSSDIGKNLAKSILKRKNDVVLTYRRKKVKNLDCKQIKLDISLRKNIDKFSKNKLIKNWTNLVLLPASQKPIGLFEEVDENDWIKSLELNFTNQIYLIKKLLKCRSKHYKNKNIILWSGPGSNSAPKYYSAYTISKIALTKMTELLDKELSDVKVSIIGPGWVKTKIHKETLNSKKLARENYQNTLKRFKNNNFSSTMDDVVNCFNKVISLDKKAAGGRNFSVQFDKWGNKKIKKILLADENIYKLRRDFNDFNFSEINAKVIKILNFLLQNKNFFKKKSLIYKSFCKILIIKCMFDLNLNDREFCALLVNKTISGYLNNRRKRSIIFKKISKNNNFKDLEKIL